MTKTQKGRTSRPVADEAGEADFSDSAVPLDPDDETVIEGQVIRERAGLSKIALVVAIVALLGGGAGLFVGLKKLQGLQAELNRVDQASRSTRDQQSGLATSLQEMGRRFDAQRQQIEAQKQALAAQQAGLDEERTRLQQQAAEIRDALQSVHQRIGRSSTQWMAAEAGYLMHVANNRLQLEGDIETAITALQAADDRLRDTGDPSWVGVREILAAEIARLKGAGRVDLAGLSARLAGLGEEVKALKLLGTEPVPVEQRNAPPAPIETDSGDQRSWETLLEDSWQGFKSIMVIRHHGQPVSAMLPPDQQYFVYQNLRLQLEAARTALLQRDQTLYDTSLATARQWLDEFFDPDDGATRAMQQEIDKLGGVQLRPELPDISRSLMALQARMKQLSGQGGDGA